jgi:hypothetical protein
VIYDGLEISKAMFAAFEAANLIEPVEVEIKLDEHTQYDLPDLFTISQERFAALDGAALEGCIGPGSWPPPNGSCRRWAMSDSWSS